MKPHAPWGFLLLLSCHTPPLASPLKEREPMKKEPFFTHDRQFYKQLFSLMGVVALQNLVAYSVNMVDNMMLGGYSQQALSGAAVVNQIFFLVQQLTIAIGEALVMIGAQYWGQKRTEPIRKLTFTALRLGLCCGVGFVALFSLFPEGLLSIFTSDESIIREGCAYLSLIQYSFVLFILTNVLMAALRSVKTVRISFGVAVVSLFINLVGNYALIFGHFGCPELGVRGAAISTVISRTVELLVVLVYLLRFDRKLGLFRDGIPAADPALTRDYWKNALPVVTANMLWAVSVPMQTAILGHLSPDAIAANSVATTFYQYLKVVVIAMSSSSAVMIGNAIGSGDLGRVRAEARTLSVIDVTIGLILGAALFLLRMPLLSFYRMTDTALVMADHLMIVMSVVMVGMSYQMPVSGGIIRGSGDVKFSMYMNLISVYAIVIPLSFASAFWWKWPVELVVLALQSDQIFKGLPTFLRFRSYKWIRKLTRE